MKEKMLQKIGRAELRANDVKRLRAVLIDAVMVRGGREYRRYCRLAARIWNDELRKELQFLSEEGDPVGARARMMRRYVEQAAEDAKRSAHRKETEEARE